jgi:hypothetical protein
MIEEIELESIVLSGKGSDGFFYLQVEGSGEGGARPPGHVLWPIGTGGRPLDPVTGPDGQRGPAAEGLVFRAGGESYTMVTLDPRVHALLPDPGKGGAFGGYGAWLATDSKARLSVSTFWGSGIQGRTPGDWTVTIPKTDAEGSPSHTITVDRQANTITIAHADGLTLTITNTKILLGGTGGHTVMIDSGSVTAFYSAIVAAFGSLGKTVAMPTGYLATKVEAL